MSLPLSSSETKDVECSQNLSRLIVDLNSIGADLYHLGDDAPALDIFKAAIQCLRNKTGNAGDPEMVALERKVAAKTREMVERKERESQIATRNRECQAELNIYQPPGSATDTGPERLLSPLRCFGLEQQQSSAFEKKILYNMALIYLRNKSCETALKLFYLSLPSNQGNEDSINDIPSTFVFASAMNNIGHIHYMAGRYKDARDCFMIAIQRATSVNIDEGRYFFDERGVPAKSILRGIEETVLCNLGRVSFIEGEYENALMMCRSSLLICLQDSEKDAGMKTKVIAAFANMGILHQQNNSPEEALFYYQSFLDEARKYLDEHEDARTTQIYSEHIVAILGKTFLIHCQQGKYNDRVAQDLSVSVGRMQATRSALGCGHSLLPPILSHIGSILVNGLGEYDDAIAFFSQALQVLRSLSPHDQCQKIEVALVLNHLGHAHELAGNQEAAMEHYAEALLCEPNLSGANRRALHPVFALIHYRIGMIHYENESPDEAMKAFRQALQIRRFYAKDMNQSGVEATESKKELAAMLYNTGIIQLDIGLVSDALSSFTESLDLRRAVLGTSHIQVAESLYQIATIHHKMGETDTALNIYFQIIQIEKRAFGPRHPKVAVTLCNAAQILQLQGKLESALNLYRVALNIIKETTGDESRSVAEILYSMGHIRLLLGDLNEANLLFARALVIGLPEDRRNIIFLLTGIGSAAPAA